eukprot:Skav228904  [mRNA]  locus=scaffold118:80435:91318:+ [translate_table: standard]
MHLLLVQFFVTEEREKEFIMSVPPDPADVRYEDLEMDPRKAAASQMIGYGHVLRSALNGCLIAGLFFGFIPIVAGITNLLTLESVSKVWIWRKFFSHNPSLAALWDGLASSIGLNLFMSFLPTFLAAWHIYAWEQHYIQQWYFYFLAPWTRTSLNPWGLLGAVVVNPTALLKLLAQSLPAATHFYLNYVPLQWGTHGTNMVRYMNLFKFLGFRKALIIYIILMTGVLLERADSIVPGVIAGSSAVLWLYSYRRFNHKFHLENLPLKDIKVSASIEKRLEAKKDYVQPELVHHEDSPKARKEK